jgi:hypothetical protein
VGNGFLLPISIYLIPKQTLAHLPKKQKNNAKDAKDAKDAKEISSSVL